MGNQLLTRNDLADLVEQHVGSLVEALRSPAGHPAGGSTLRTAPWRKVADLDGQSYSWPEGVEHYTPFEVWETADDRGSVRIGLGRVAESREIYGKERYWWLIFKMAGDHKERPIVVFNEADDHESTRDLVSAIKGKGKGGRSMFAPGDELPGHYDHLPVETFKDRVSGPPVLNRLAVVAPGGDREIMLDHALIQLRLRS